MATFNYLFSPIKLGSVELKNRIVWSPHSSNYDRGTEQDCAYLEARAKGGVGAIILAGAVNAPFDKLPHGASSIGTPKGLEGHRKAIEAIHRGGAKAIVEMGAGTGSQASAEVPQGMFRNQPKTMSIFEIKYMIGNAIECAEKAKQAGADGIELMLAFGAALHWFVSPLYNKRTDEYGGSMANCLRIPIEILAGIREKCGKDFVIGVVIDVDESNLDGYTLEEGVEMCKMLADTGYVDYLRINANNIKAEEGHLHYPSSYLPQGIALYASAAVREVVENIPIIGSHRINTPEFAEQALAEGACDLVSMARALIADPELPNKARSGELEEIRTCIGCVEACYQRYILNVPISCSVNPEAGNETLVVPPAQDKKKVLVVGGGLAGMEAARVAAQRGHAVTLVEKERVLGGTVSMQAKLPGLSDRADFIRWMGLQLQKLNVDVRLDFEASPEFVMGFGADQILIATGAKYDRKGITQDRMFPIPGLETTKVYTPEDIVLEGKSVEGQRIVVYDTTGYVVGPGIAEMLADQGKTVDFVTHESQVGTTVKTNYLDTVLMMRILSKTNLVRNVHITSIEGKTVNLINMYTYEESSLEDIDGIVLVTSKPPAESLYHSLLGKVRNMAIIGDANNSNFINFGMYDAVQSGRRAAMQIN